MARRLVLISLCLMVATVRAAQPIQFEKAIQLAGVEGRIDHLSADSAGGRLFVSALANNTVEVIDWNAGTRIKTLSGLNEPQGVLYVPENKRLYVASGGDGSVTIFDAASFRMLKTIKLGSDADNIRAGQPNDLGWLRQRKPGSARC